MQEKVTIQSVFKEGVEIDVTVAAEQMQPGDLALHIPEKLIVTLDRIFDGDGPLAELLTTNKLSEIAYVSFLFFFSFFILY